MALLRSTGLATAIVAALLTPLAATAPADGADRVTSRSQQEALIGVSCPRPSVCMAVGARAVGAGTTLAELWNGKRWRVLPTPSATGPRGRSLLLKVSCASVASCVALGFKDSNSSGTLVNLLEAWNGVRWRVLDLRVPRGGHLFGISCVRRACMIVGDHPTSAGIYQPLAMQLRGNRLRPLKLRAPRGSDGASLVSVSCAGASFCAAVGNYAMKNVGTSNLAETWNGTTWRLTRTWHPGGADTVLDSVSCASPGLCMAGGAPVAGRRPALMLNLLWKGGRWRTLNVVGRQLPGLLNVPSGTSCPTVSSCVATEYGLNSGGSAALTWNGGRILRVHQVRQPAIGQLLSISCPRAARCIAVGAGAQGPATPNGAFAERWNGRSWKLLQIAVG